MRHIDASERRRSSAGSPAGAGAVGAGAAADARGASSGGAASPGDTSIGSGLPSRSSGASGDPLAAGRLPMNMSIPIGIAPAGRSPAASAGRTAERLVDVEGIRQLEPRPRRPPARRHGMSWSSGRRAGEGCPAGPSDRRAARAPAGPADRRAARCGTRGVGRSGARTAGRVSRAADVLARRGQIDSRARAGPPRGAAAAGARLGGARCGELDPIEQWSLRHGRAGGAGRSAGAPHSGTDGSASEARVSAPGTDDQARRSRNLVTPHRQSAPGLNRRGGVRALILDYHIHARRVWRGRPVRANRQTVPPRRRHFSHHAAAASTWHLSSAPSGWPCFQWLDPGLGLGGCPVGARPEGAGAGGAGSGAPVSAVQRRLLPLPAGLAVQAASAR